MIDLLLWSFVISLALNLALFLVAFKIQSDKLTDISYATTFIAIAVFSGIWAGWTTLSILLAVLVGMWGIRLGGFLLYRVSVIGKDARFDEMRGSFWKFGQFWVLQAVTVWVLMLPVVFVAGVSDAQPTLISWIGLCIALIGIAIEATADIQKFRFTQDKANKGRWIEQGIWRYSRHPNYFGEILVWIGVYVCAAHALSVSVALIALVSPVFISLLLLFVSGIPLLEKSADKRWGDDAAYRQYKASTSILVPLPRRRI